MTPSRKSYFRIRRSDGEYLWPGGIAGSDGEYLWPGGIAGNSFGSIEHASLLTGDLPERAAKLLARLDADRAPLHL